MTSTVRRVEDKAIVELRHLTELTVEEVVLQLIMSVRPVFVSKGLEDGHGYPDCQKATALLVTGDLKIGLVICRTRA